MQIEIKENPNCEASEQFVYKELGPSRPIRAIKVLERGKEIFCEVVGVEKNGLFTGAFATKIADSGAGFAYVIHGGAWGIRLRPEARTCEDWDFSNKHQRGEPFKIYGDEEDIVYADIKTSF